MDESSMIIRLVRTPQPNITLLGYYEVLLLNVSMFYAGHIDLYSPLNLTQKITNRSDGMIAETCITNDDWKKIEQDCPLVLIGTQMVLDDVFHSSYGDIRIYYKKT